MKLYLTLEEGDLKIERTMVAEYSMFCDHDKYGEIIEEMSDQLHSMIQENKGPFVDSGIDIAADDPALKKEVPLPEGVEPNSPF